MAEKELLPKHINPGNIQKAFLYERGLTAELAVLKAFGCDIRLVQNIAQLGHYCREPIRYLKDLKESEDAIPCELEVITNDSQSLLRHKAILEHREQLKILKNTLLQEVSNTRYKSSDLLVIHDECEDIDADEISITYKSLYSWFLKYSINVSEWENLAYFQKQKLSDINIGKKIRSTTKKEDTQTAILAIAIFTLAKSRRNLHKENFSPNITAITEEIFKNPKNTLKKSTIRPYIDSAIQYYAEHCNIKSKN